MKMKLWAVWLELVVLVVSLAIESEAMTYVFFENEIYLGFLTSSRNEIAGEEVRLFSNLIDDYLAIENTDVKEGMIFFNHWSMFRCFRSRSR